MRKVGKEIDAAERWREVGEGYVATIDSAYQRHRLGVIHALLPDPIGRSVIDFGCGDGVLLEEAARRGATDLIGIDIDDRMIAAARKRIPSARFMQGGVELLKLAENFDCLIAANVLAYMTDDEEQRFYERAAKVVCPGGALVVTHSNSLFDMFTLNGRTVGFYRENFGVNPSSLLRQPDKPERASFNIRENPLTYRHKLAAHGFREDRQEFMNFHPVPPLLSTDDPDDMDRPKRDTLDWPAAERWKLMFQCSMFGVRAIRS